MILLTPGPVQVKKGILNATSKKAIFHRSNTFENIFRSCTDKIKTIFGADDSYVSLITAGSGTMAIEAFVQSVIDPSADRVLVVSNGHFGARLQEIIKVHNSPYRVVSFNLGDPVSLKSIEVEIKKFKPVWLLMVAHETSSGMINPVFEVGKLCQKYGVKFMIDAVSAIGGMSIDMVRQNIDACISVPNKGLEGLPGISFICIKADHLKNNLRPKTFYLNLKRYYKFSQKNQMPVTPAIQSVVAFEKALILYLNEGFQRRKLRYEALSGAVISHAKKLGLEILISNREFHFPGLTTIILPSHISIRDLHICLLKHGFVLWFYEANQETGNRNLLQIAVMGDVKKQHIDRCFKHIKNFIKQNE